MKRTAEFRQWGLCYVTCTKMTIQQPNDRKVLESTNFHARYKSAEDTTSVVLLPMSVLKNRYKNKIVLRQDFQKLG